MDSQSEFILSGSFPESSKRRESAASFLFEYWVQGSPLPKEV
jgi:hypothetical protein